MKGPSSLFFYLPRPLPHFREERKTEYDNRKGFGGAIPPPSSRIHTQIKDISNLFALLLSAPKETTASLLVVIPSLPFSLCCLNVLRHHCDTSSFPSLYRHFFYKEEIISYSHNKYTLHLPGEAQDMQEMTRARNQHTISPAIGCNGNTLSFFFAFLLRV